jgi:hypothetical protein
MWRSSFKFTLLLLGCGLALIVPVYLIQHPYPPKSFTQLILGISGSAMMASGAVFYALRKRIKVLKKLGQMKYWLDFHITFCLLGPLLITYHSAMTVKAPNSGIAFYVMLVVMASGVVGRYIYRHFQFSLSGERANLKEISEETGQLDQQINQHFSESQKMISMIKRFFELRQGQKSGGFVRSLYTMVRVDWLERRLRRQIVHYLKNKRPLVASNTSSAGGPFETLLITRISLEKKASILEVTTKLFSHWHKLHVPLIWILLLSFIAHVAAVLIF